MTNGEIVSTNLPRRVENQKKIVKMISKVIFRCFKFKLIVVKCQ